MKALFNSHWMNQIRILSVSVLCLAGLVSCENDEDTKGDEVTLILRTWRTEDVAQMNRINALFTQEHPDITVKFEPIAAETYDSVSLRQLADGKGADVIYLHSYDMGRMFYDGGYLYDLTNKIPNLDAYNQTYVDAWSSAGITYAVPSLGVTQGIYYQKDLFEQYNLTEPTTWAEFITVCETLKNGGETVIAQGTADIWTLHRCVFSAIGPNFYGGELARQALIAGTASLTDPGFIEAFTKVDTLKHYFPANFTTMGNEEARQMFGRGDAAMFISGSWEIAELAKLGADNSKIGWFPAPLKKAGDKLQYCYHVDAGIALNKSTKHLEAALEYIEWVSGSEYAQAIMSELPGFFSYTPGVSDTPDNPLAKEMYQTIATSDLTVRTMYQGLSTPTKTGDELMNETLREMLTGTYTPQQAAAYIQGQLNNR